jgi:hypothetical protein
MSYLLGYLGSTSLRSLRELRLGGPRRRRGEQMRGGPEVVLSENGGLQPLECSIRLPHHSRALAGQHDRAGRGNSAMRRRFRHLA